MGWSGCSQPSETANVAEKTKSILAPEEAEVDLGVLYSGGSARMILKIKNTSDRSCDVAKLESSCECTSLKLQTMKVGPSEETYLLISTDMTKEPDFLGDLRIEAKGSAPSGAEVMLFHIRLSVIAREKVDQLLASRTTPAGQPLVGANEVRSQLTPGAVNVTVAPVDVAQPADRHRAL